MKLSSTPVLLAACAILTLVSCAPPTENFKPQPAEVPRLQNLNPEERREVAPNALFVAVLEGDLAAVKAEVNRDPALLDFPNERDGDSPLAVAIRLERKDVAMELVEQLVPDQFKFRNSNGEGYIFLAAKYGMFELIHRLALRFYDSPDSADGFEFKDLDFPNKDGMKGLDVARDRRAAATLKQYYYYGWMERPRLHFMMNHDHKDRIFLHHAALDGRTDVIEWAAEQLCGHGDLEDSDWRVVQGASYLWNRGLRIFQTYAGDIGAWQDLLFNRLDGEGNSPLHLAARAKNAEAVKALAKCDWLDFKRQNANSDIPLQVFLSALDPQQPVLSTQDRSLFQFLAEQQTTLRWDGRTAYLNHPNKQGNTSLHIAARLSDPYPYTELAKVGNTAKGNASRQTPAQIFRSRHPQVPRP